MMPESIETSSTKLVIVSFIIKIFKNKTLTNTKRLRKGRNSASPCEQKYYANNQIHFMYQSTGAMQGSDVFLAFDFGQNFENHCDSHGTLLSRILI